MATDRLADRRSGKSRLRPESRHRGDPAGVAAVGLVRSGREEPLRVARLQAPRVTAGFDESAVKPLRQRTSFETDESDTVLSPRQPSDQVFRVRQCRAREHRRAGIIDDANGRVVQRDIQSYEELHPFLFTPGLIPAR